LTYCDRCLFGWGNRADSTGRRQAPETVLLRLKRELALSGRRIGCLEMTNSQLHDLARRLRSRAVLFLDSDIEAAHDMLMASSCWTTCTPPESPSTLC
jgi:hypothetical protein